MGGAGCFTQEAVAVGIADIEAGRYTEFNNAASLRSHINSISKRVLAKSE